MLHIKQYINSIFSSNTYLLWVDGEKDCWLVDCGDIHPLLDDIQSIGLNIVGVLLTHAHFDHIYGLNDVLSIFPSLKIYTNLYGHDALLSEKLNLSKYHQTPFVVKEENVICVIPEDESIIKILGLDVEILHVPGHNASCIAYKLGNYLFSGDAYIPGVKVVTNVPKANKPLALQNYSLLEGIAKGMIVCAGHGEIVNADLK